MNEQAGVLTRLFGSTKALITMLVIAGAFGALYLGKSTWDQVRELLMVVIPSFLATHAASDIAHTIAAPKLELAKSVSIKPPPIEGEEK